MIAKNPNIANEKPTACLVLADGTIFYGKGFGAPAQGIGDLGKWYTFGHGFKYLVLQVRQFTLTSGLHGLSLCVQHSHKSTC